MKYKILRINHPFHKDGGFYRDRGVYKLLMNERTDGFVDSDICYIETIIKLATYANNIKEI